jgi:hypothetical protein
MSVRREYEWTATAQRMVVTVSASRTDWIDLAIDPERLAGRPIAAVWTSRVAFDPRTANESIEEFRARLVAVEIRFIAEAPSGWRAFPLVPESWCHFPSTRGCLEVRWPGARADDRGTHRIDMYAQVAEPVVAPKELIDAVYIDETRANGPFRTLASLPDPI